MRTSTFLALVIAVLGSSSACLGVPDPVPGDDGSSGSPGDGGGSLDTGASDGTATNDSGAAPPDVLYLTFEGEAPFAGAVGPDAHPSADAALVAGRFGQGLQLGDTSYAWLDDSAAFTQVPYTVEMWVVREEAPGCASIFGDQDASATPDRELNLNIGSGGDLRCGSNTAGVNVEVDDNGVFIPVGEWHHVAVVRDEGGMTVALDGVYGASVSLTDVWPSSSAFTIGRSTGGSCVTYGAIDELKLSGWAKSEAELALSLATGVGEPTF